MTAYVKQHRTTRSWVMVTALLLVSLWLPSTSHAWLESVGLIHSHAESNHDAPHDAADGYCRLEHGLSSLKGPAAFALQFSLPFYAHEVTTAMAPPDFAVESVSLRGVAPPELSQTWQFSERAAGPNRAPPAVG